jgi:hypothetical protein
MFRTRYLVLLAVGLAMCWMVGSQARADTLMLDTFDSSTEVDINTGIGAPRQTGSLVPVGGITYSATKRSGSNWAIYNTYSGIGPNEPELIINSHSNGTTHGAWQDQNETSLVGTHYKASVHVDFQDGFTDWCYMAVSEGKDSVAHYLPDTGVIVDINPQGQWELFLGGRTNMVGSGTVAAAQHYDLGLDINEGGATTSVSLLVNGAPVSGGSGSFAWGNPTDRYFGIGANLVSKPNIWFNDLKLEAIPEPSSMAILFSALVGLLAYAWRKRR